MKVSIITISFNNLEGLKDTYNSIARQTFKDYEWIVIDGGSTDGTKEFLTDHNAELAFWCCEPDKGVYNAQNKGTQHAKGEYCIYMNSGDTFYAEDVLEKLFESVHEADIIYGNWVLKYDNGKDVLRKGPDVADLVFFFDDNMCHQAMAIKTNAVLERPYDESFRIYGDWEEWLALYMQGKKFEKVDLTICDFLVGGLSTGDDASDALKAERLAEIKRITDKYYSEPWKKTMQRIAPILRENQALKSHVKLTYEAFGKEENRLTTKKVKHIRIIRILGWIIALLMISNILLLLYVASI